MIIAGISLLYDYSYRSYLKSVCYPTGLDQILYDYSHCAILIWDQLFCFILLVTFSFVSCYVIWNCWPTCAILMSLSAFVLRHPVGLRALQYLSELELMS